MKTGCQEVPSTESMPASRMPRGHVMNKVIGGRERARVGEGGDRVDEEILVCG